MQAAWYDNQGPARVVLQVGEMGDPEPGPGELRIRVAAHETVESASRRGRVIVTIEEA